MKRERNENKRKTNFRIIIFVLSGSIMIGHGLRMLYQGIFAKGSVYAPNTFDLFFDWLSLAILGSIILYWGFSAFYQKEKEKQYKNNNSPTLSIT